MSSQITFNKTPFLLLLTLLIQISIIKPQSIGIFDYSHEADSHLFIQAGPLSSKSSIIPFGYNNVGICESKKILKAEDTLGEILTGQTLYTTGHVAHTNVNKYCQVLCHNYFGTINEKILKKLIKRKYFAKYYLDKLPAGLLSYNQKEQKTTIYYNRGIPIGELENGKYLIYNHLQFHILLNDIGDNKYNVVGFNILPISIKHNEDKPICATEANDIVQNFQHEKQYLVEGEKILYTYDIIFEQSDITLASRWDHYKMTKKNIHWTGIIISNCLILIFGIIIGCIVSRTVNKDINSYNYRVSTLENVDDNDWKNVAGDVFRAPLRNKTLLSSFLGSGMQLFFMFAITLFLGVFGFLNPEKRANLLNLGILFFCFMGLPGGYVSAVVYKFFGGSNWIKNSVLTAFIFPGTLVFGYIIVNIVLSLEKSNAAVKVSQIMSLFVLWIFCTFPLILIGSFLGAKSKTMTVKNKINPVPSIIPDKPWYLHYKFLVIITGLISFATIFVELNYVMASLWRQQIYFVATFLWISFYLFIIITGELSIVVVFCNLCYGDYNWWWRSFIIGASPVVYFLAYTVYYFFYLKIRRISAMVVYFGMMSLISAMVMFISGSTSVLITFGFLKKIYARIKSD